MGGFSSSSSPSIAPSGIETSGRATLSTLTCCLQSHLRVLKPAQANAETLTTAPFNRTFGYWNLLRNGKDRNSVAPFNRTFGYWNKTLAPKERGYGDLQSHLRVLKPIKWKLWRNWWTPFNRTFGYWNFLLVLIIFAVAFTFNRTFGYWNQPNT